MKKIFCVAILALVVGLAACGREEEIVVTDPEIVVHVQDPPMYEETTETPTAEEPTAQPQPSPIPAAENAGIHGFLSRIEYGNNVAYILGSMHVGRPHWFPLADIVEDAMARSDVFAFEFDLRLFEDMAVIMYMMQYMALPDGQTLEDVLPPDVFEHFIAALDTFPNVTYEMVANFTPAFAYYFITLNEGMPHMGVDAEYSVDYYVMAFAEAYGLPIIGLNDVFSEVAFLFDWPEEVAISAMAEFPDYQALIGEVNEMDLADAYENQDAARIIELTINSLAENLDTPHGRHTYEITVLARCMIFAEEIERLLRETEEPTTYFITIGALHVLYDHIFEMLEANGLEVVCLWQ
ncbi:MAG: TraB/GumN family protein [Defluviitaleaceae bacterium]|nr:TraB/GumN family protein [Defluviitaleaceae bacterium]